MARDLFRSLAPALALLVLVSGCIAPGADPPGANGDDGTDRDPAAAWTKDPCDPSEATAIAANLPWIPAWQGTMEERAERFATALGHDLPPLDEDSPDAGNWNWNAANYEIRYTEAEADGRSGSPPDVPMLRYSTAGRWPTGDAADMEQELRDFLDRFGVPADVDLRFHEGRSFVQTWEGEAIRHTTGEAIPGDGSGEYGRWSGFYLRPFYDMDDAVATVSEAQAMATAEAYDRCALDREGKTEAAGYVHRTTDHVGHDVRNDSLVHTISLHYDQPPPPGHCGFGRIVHVDAQTGAVHGWEWPPCD